MAATERLINSTEELQQGMGAVQSDLNFDVFKSFVDDAEMRHVIPAIGYLMYESLKDDSLTGEQLVAQKLFKKAVANFAIHYFVAFGSVQINDAGIFVTNNTGRLPASDKKLYLLRTQSRADGFAALESAVNLLEDNPSYFSLYINSTAHQNNRQFYINTTATFNQNYSINNNFEVFAQLKSVMQTIESNYIDPALGETVSQALRTAILQGSTSADQKQLLIRIARAAAPLTIAEAIPYRLFDFDSSGLVTATIKGNIENIEVATEAPMTAMQLTMNNAQKRGESEMAKLRKYLNDNVSKFTGYTAVDLDAMSKLNDTPRGVYFS